MLVERPSSPPPSPPATVLTGKLKVFIFKEMIHQHDQFAHAGGHGNEGFFAGGEQAGIKRFEDAVMADGAQGGHVEGAAHRAAATTDMAAAFEFTTVTVIGGDARQGRRRLGIEPAQFGHFRQHGGGHDWSDPANGFQPFGLPRQVHIGSDERGDGLVALVDLFIQQLEELPVLADAESIRVMIGAVGFHGAGVDELSAALGDVRQLLLLGRKPGRRCRFKSGTIGGEDGGIDGIGLGPPALGAGKVPDTTRFNDADGEVGSLQGPHHPLFITAGGLADHMGSRVATKEFEELGMAFGIIGDGVETAGEVELQRKLGNIQADMEDSSVLTHTCKDTSPGDWKVTVLKQRFEFRTMGTRKTRWGTHHAQAYARRGRFHAYRPPPGCNRAEDSSLARFRKPAKQDDLEHTRRGDSRWTVLYNS